VRVSVSSSLRTQRYCGRLAFQAASAPQVPQRRSCQRFSAFLLALHLRRISEKTPGVTVMAVSMTLSRLPKLLKETRSLKWRKPAKTPRSTGKTQPTVTTRSLRSSSRNQRPNQEPASGSSVTDLSDVPDLVNEVLPFNADWRQDALPCDYL